MASDVPLLAFARETVPEGPPAWRLTARLLQALAWVFVAAAVLVTVVYAWMLTQVADSGTMDGAWLGTLVAVGFLGLFGVVGITLVLAWWASYAYGHWCRRRRTGYGHALALGIVIALYIAVGFVDLAEVTSWSWQTVSYAALAAGTGLVGLGVVIGCCMPSSRREFRAPTESRVTAVTP